MATRRGQQRVDAGVSVRALAAARCEGERADVVPISRGLSPEEKQSSRQVVSSVRVQPRRVPPCHRLCATPDFLCTLLLASTHYVQINQRFT